MICKDLGLVFARLMLARISSASLVQANGWGWSFQPPVNAPMAAVSWRTEVKEQLAGVTCRVICWFSGRAYAIPRSRETVRPSPRGPPPATCPAAGRD